MKYILCINKPSQLVGNYIIFLLLYGQVRLVWHAFHQNLEQRFFYITIIGASFFLFFYSLLVLLYQNFCQTYLYIPIIQKTNAEVHKYDMKSCYYKTYPVHDGAIVPFCVQRFNVIMDENRNYYIILLCRHKNILILLLCYNIITNKPFNNYYHHKTLITFVTINNLDGGFLIVHQRQHNIFADLSFSCFHSTLQIIYLTIS